MTDESGTSNDSKETSPSPAPSANFLTLFMLVITIFILFNPSMRIGIGMALGVVFGPLIGFGGFLPVITLLCMGIITTIFNTYVRFKYTDHIKMAETQHKTRHLNNLFREAYKKKDMAKVDKLKDIRKSISSEQLEASSKQMNTLPYTMIIVMVLFSWMWTFVDSLDYTIISVPWSSAVNLLASTGFPNWILLYSLISIAFSIPIQVIYKIKKFGSILDDVEYESTGD